MKNILILLFISIRLSAQTDTIDFDNIYSEYLYYDTVAVIATQYDTATQQDTIKTLFLVSDTSRVVSTNFCLPDSLYLIDVDYTARWERGYIVRTYYSLVSDLYLDEYKKPFSDNIVVWITKELQ